jgi:hypothetical protein
VLPNIATLTARLKMTWIPIRTKVRNTFSRILIPHSLSDSTGLERFTSRLGGPFREACVSQQSTNRAGQA